MRRSLCAGTFATLWLTLFLDLLAFGIILPVTPYYAESFGASPATVTLLSASFSIAQLVCAPWLGRLSDRLGRRPVMLVSIAGSVLAHLTLFVSSSLAVVFLARIFAGMSNANVATAHAYVADRVPQRDRARIMGLMGSAIGLGFVIGPALGGLLSTSASPALPFGVAAGLAAINLGMAWVFLPESHRPADAAPRRRPVFAPLLDASLWRSPLGWLILVNGAFFVAFAAMESTFALYCEASFGWGARNTGLLYVLIGIAILLTQGLLVGRAVAALGEKRCLVVGIAVVAAGLVACATADSVPILAVGAMSIAVGNGLATPSLSSLVSRAARHGQQGHAQGLAQASSALARIGAPIAAGTAFEIVSPAAPMLAGAALLVVVCIPLALRKR